MMPCNSSVATPQCYSQLLGGALGEEGLGDIGRVWGGHGERGFGNGDRVWEGGGRVGEEGLAGTGGFLGRFQRFGEPGEGARVGGPAE